MSTYEKIATECLKKTNWALEPAINHFYSSGLATTPGASSLNLKSIEDLYSSYKEKDGDTIQAEGVVRFCEDLDLDPSDIVMLIISYYMGAAVMCEFSKEEFTGGMVKMGCDSLDKLKKKIPDLRSEIRNEERFKDIYAFAYGFSCEKGQKCIQLDVALGMWKLLIGETKPWPLLEDWCEFLLKHHNRAISKDTWVQLYDFIQTIKPDFSNFDETAAWPYLLDEFVDHVKEKRGG
ncbi:hypothetical protein CEUSTIGMA_g8823.t1 [Chlamydomonas eustigma]|uniref:Defective in cullin neddylation protein n=1 Tax=Chlamydomonas eustigma TaxID=1157962 RepID=A0A250XEP7_9CHLO|nr:hypothetical protein CEUSTIGMA_g8823.t1 [Chlamydomonas eustigma]|eukprot:GAX81392.1 hypothetical protein CEUSTIGMA_g8823.t1 [Chlamydomonas eustigma]